MRVDSVRYLAVGISVREGGTIPLRDYKDTKSCSLRGRRISPASARRMRTGWRRLRPYWRVQAVSNVANYSRRG